MHCRAACWLMPPPACSLPHRQIHTDAPTVDITRGEAPGIGKILVHLIDCKGNSVAHMRVLASGLTV